MNRVLTVLFFSIAFEGLAYAGDLVSGATIVAVNNVSSNKDQFGIQIQGGEGVCANQGILFPSWKALDEGAYQRAYSAALTALTTGMKVKVHNYESDHCHAATQIRLSLD